MRKLILALTLCVATLTISPAAEAQPEDTIEATAEAPAAETSPASTIPAVDLEGVTAPSETAEPSPAPDSATESKQSEPAGDDIRTQASEVEELVRAGKWVAALGVSMLLGVAVFRKGIFHNVEWFKTKQGGYAAAGGVAVLTIVGLSISQGFSIDVVAAGIAAAGFASGVHTAANDFKSSRES